MNNNNSNNSNNSNNINSNNITSNSNNIVNNDKNNNNNQMVNKALNNSQNINATPNNNDNVVEVEIESINNIDLKIDDLKFKNTIEYAYSTNESNNQELNQQDQKNGDQQDQKNDDQQDQKNDDQQDQKNDDQQDQKNGDQEDQQNDDQQDQQNDDQQEQQNDNQQEQQNDNQQEQQNDNQQDQQNDNQNKSNDNSNSSNNTDNKLNNTENSDNESNSGGQKQPNNQRQRQNDNVENNQTKKDADDFRNRNRNKNKQQGNKEEESAAGTNSKENNESNDSKDGNNNKDSKNPLNKINDLKNKANAIKDPKQALKNKVKNKAEEAGKKVMLQLMKNPYFWIIVGVIILFIMLIGFIAGDGGAGSSTHLCKFPNAKYDYTIKKIELYQTLLDNDPIYIPYEKFIKGMTYEDMAQIPADFDYGKGDRFTGFWVSTVVNATSLLAFSKFDGESNNIVVHTNLLKDLKYDIHYCNIDTGTGCDGDIGPASEEMKKELDEAYDSVKYYLFVPLLTSTVKTNNDLTGIFSGNPRRLDKSTLERIVKKDISEINTDDESYVLSSLKNIDPDYWVYKIYDHSNISESFEAPCQTSLWWPIGSSDPTDSENKIYSGRPACVNITSPYGYRGDVYNANGIKVASAGLHAGIDISCEGGKPVIAVADGIVKFQGVDGGSGNMVELQHDDGIISKYCHLSTIEVESGQEVVQGQIIGRVGMTGAATGNHLHFEIIDSKNTPQNPEMFVSALNPRL